MDPRRGSGTPPWRHHAGPTMAARAWPKPSPRQLRGLAADVGSLRCVSLNSSALWMGGGSSRPFLLLKCYFIVLGTLARRGGRGASKMGLAGRPTGPWAGRPRGPEGPLELNFLPKSSRCFWSICGYACGPLDDVYFGIIFEINPGVVTSPDS